MELTTTAPLTLCACSCGCQAVAKMHSQLCVNCWILIGRAYDDPPTYLHVSPGSAYFPRARAIARLLAAARKLPPRLLPPHSFEIIEFGRLAPSFEIYELMDAIVDLRAADEIPT